MPVRAKKKSEELEFYNPTNIIFVLFQYFINVLVHLGPCRSNVELHMSQTQCKCT